MQTHVQSVPIVDMLTMGGSWAPLVPTLAWDWRGEHWSRPLQTHRGTGGDMMTHNPGLILVDQISYSFLVH